MGKLTKKWAAARERRQTARAERKNKKLDYKHEEAMERGGVSSRAAVRIQRSKDRRETKLARASVKQTLADKGIDATFGGNMAKLGGNIASIFGGGQQQDQSYNDLYNYMRQTLDSGTYATTPRATQGSDPVFAGTADGGLYTDPNAEPSFFDGVMNFITENSVLIGGIAAVLVVWQFFFKGRKIF
jgi:hypothetical protein